MAQPHLSARTLLALHVCMAALAGCAPDSADAAALPQWSTNEELRIGAPEEPLSRVDQLAVDDQGGMYVLQSLLNEIRVFDSSGTPLRTIGESGTGEGQFERLYGVGFVADTLYAIDFGQRRISYFSAEGELFRSHDVAPPPVDAPLRPAMPFAVFPDGSMAIGHAWASSISMVDLQRVPQLRTDANSEASDTVAWVSYERTARRAEYQQRSIVVGSPLSDDSFVIFSSDGSRLVTVDRRLQEGAATSTFGVTVSDGYGDTIYSRRYEYEPIEVARSVIDRAVEMGAQRVAGAFPSGDEALAFVRDAMFLPAHYPPATDARFSEDGTLWIQRESVPGQPQRWMVLDESGEPTAEIELPEGLQLHVLAAETLWGVETDERGAPSVVRYGIGR